MSAARTFLLLETWVPIGLRQLCVERNSVGSAEAEFKLDWERCWLSPFRYAAVE